MKIKLVSDLHLEFSDVNIVNDNNYDVLILGGDICIAQDLHDFALENVRTAAMLEMLSSKQLKAQRFRDFFKRCSFQFPHVIYIMGNHEFYHGKFYAAIDYMREECARYPNVYMLEQDMKIIDDVVFVGGTLWTNMNKRDPLTMSSITSIMNDFRTIRNDHRSYSCMSPQDVVIRHDRTLNYIRLIVEKYSDNKCVVVGHHSPSFRSVTPAYVDETLMNGAYHSDLSEFILDHPQIVLWTHGHSHYASDYRIGETRVVCNPRGYQDPGYSEHTGWNPSIVLEI